MQKSEMLEFANIVAEAVVKALDGKSVSANTKVEKTAYAKTESLLCNYNGFKKILEDRKRDIEEIRTYGVPEQSAGFEYNPHSNIPHGITLEEERIDAAVREIERSLVDVVKAIRMVDNGLYKLRHDPYHVVLSLRYIEGCTLEDIGVQLNCDTSTVSRNKNRLVKELSMWLFPNEVATECMN